MAFVSTRVRTTIATLLAFGTAPASHAQSVVSVDWTDPGSTGTLDGIDVTFNSAIRLFSADLTGPDFDAAPLSTMTESVEFGASADWSATFAQAIDDLLLYAILWRGNGSDPGVPVNYTFDVPFTILDGLSAATVSNNSMTLTVPSDGFNDGILEFAGPVTTLSVDSDANFGFGQVLTFGIDQRPASP